MPETASKKDMSALYTPAAILIAGALIGGGLFFGLSKGGSTTPGGPSAPSVNIKNVKVAGEPYIGKENAPVVLAFWSDYQCPFCKAFEVGDVPQIPTPAAYPDLVKNYVNTGKLKIIFKDFAFLGSDSMTAAEYGRAVWDLYPDKYPAWREAMYKAQDEEGDQGFGDEASIVALSGKIAGIDALKLKAQVTSKKGEYDAMIDADKQEAASFGINGTPGFITGKQLISGAESLAVFTAAIGAQLK